MQTKNSDLKESLDCSVIQGSKLSSLLYISYTNEVSVLYKLLSDEDWMRKNLDENVKEFNNIDNEKVNFIEDINSITSFMDPAEAN